MAAFQHTPSREYARKRERNQCNSCSGTQLQFETTNCHECQGPAASESQEFTFWRCRAACSARCWIDGGTNQSSSTYRRGSAGMGEASTCKGTCHGSSEYSSLHVSMRLKKERGSPCSSAACAICPHCTIPSASTPFSMARWWVSWSSLMMGDNLLRLAIFGKRQRMNHNSVP